MEGFWEGHAWGSCPEMNPDCDEMPEYVALGKNVLELFSLGILLRIKKFIFRQKKISDCNCIISNFILDARHA